MRRPLFPSALLACGIAALGLAACNVPMQHHTSASVVDFLYPDQKDPVPATGIPHLRLPLRVGLAFVPGSAGNGSLSETRRMELLQKVAAHFQSQPYIQGIEVIPTAYLRNKGGFSNLDQVRAMYGLDEIALVSFDQMQFTDRGALSLTYWTIVGAYVVPAEKNDTQTLLDTVVFDIPSRRMLFRAPGTDRVTGRATLVNASEQLRLDSTASFDHAADQMIANLDQQLVQFRERVRAHPEEIQVERTAAYSQRVGGGGLDGGWMLLMAGMALAAFLGPYRAILYARIFARRRAGQRS